MINNNIIRICHQVFTPQTVHMIVAQTDYYFFGQNYYFRTNDHRPFKDRVFCYFDFDTIQRVSCGDTN
jgi:hypothetical protein